CNFNLHAVDANGHQCRLEVRRPKGNGWIIGKSHALLGFAQEPVADDEFTMFCMKNRNGVVARRHNPKVTDSPSVLDRSIDNTRRKLFFAPSLSAIEQPATHLA